ncbi:DUF1998 domain-containing protein [Anoxybacillus suryakundensis]|uniref:MrfA-like Zn-binding domain-containing protein n=1 Tax=Anoxybacillus suryakundensis TaxID=1325335 RepID=A0A0K6GLL8_9BACL|nr:DUF1998 domain-containing protein [Anoxybacillus suryakundensis]CUA79416.1 Domain of unknown function (DUF1998) [Anoxybacillus suryakundensis]
MKDLPLRRGQLITTFGPGALVVSPEGETAIIGALDKWYYNIKGQQLNSLHEYEVQEPRLKSLLQVKKLFLPPDFRAGYQYQGEGNVIQQTNTDVYIPLLRFPTWHYCPKCKTLHQLPLSSRTSWYHCRECDRSVKMIQVPFVIVCRHGHISDFPWQEWVHRNEDTSCEGTMKLLSTGGTTLDSLKVECSCGKDRSLKGVMIKNKVDQHNNNRSALSIMLNDNVEKEYTCPGTKPWYGSLEEKDKCSEYPVAVLKNSINVYFPIKVSAIHIPGDRSAEIESLINLFEKRGITSSLLETHENTKGKIEFVKKICPPEINEYSDSDIERAIIYIQQGDVSSEQLSTSKSYLIEHQLRKKEFETLIEAVDHSENLKVHKEWECDEVNERDLKSLFSHVNRVTRLKETIVLTGFRRLQVGTEELSITEMREGRRLLFKNASLQENNWLPAYKVYGEGIFFRLNTDRLKLWEEKSDVKEYYEKYLKRYRKNNNYIDPNISNPRYVLLHTFSHILINELSLTCGYNAASIRERLYLDENQSGILIYTSSGDSDGTFGGLVRMGLKQNFFPIVYRALERAKWCSSDPVCTEIGMSSGQGLNKLNGAACHSCTYIPETSCELQNLSLDRSLLVHPKIGFFNIV